MGGKGGVNRGVLGVELKQGICLWTKENRIYGLKRTTKYMEMNSVVYEAKGTFLLQCVLENNFRVERG